MTSIFPEILAPPSTATKGRSGFDKRGRDSQLLLHEKSRDRGSQMARRLPRWTRVRGARRRRRR